MTLPRPWWPQLRLSSLDPRPAATLLNADTAIGEPVIPIQRGGPMCHNFKVLGNPWCPLTRHLPLLQLPKSCPLQVKPQTISSSLHGHTPQMAPVPRLCAYGSLCPQCTGSSSTATRPSWPSSQLLLTVQSPTRGPPPLSSPIYFLLPQSESPRLCSRHRTHARAFSLHPLCCESWV